MSKGWSSFLVFALAIPAGIWSSFVALKLWAWFAVPLGAPMPSLVQMMGLGVLVGMYRYYPDVDPKLTEKMTGGEIFTKFLTKATLLPALALLFGWVYTKFL